MITKIPNTLLIVLCLLVLVSCQSDDDQIGNFANLEELVFIDSVLISETNGFFKRPSNSTIINDTLIGLASSQGRGVWIFDISSGKEVNSILNKSVLETSFMIAGIDISQYPFLFVLDGVTKSVYQFDLSQNVNQEEKYVNKITLDIPEGFRIMPETETFFFNGSEFIVELASTTFKSSKHFYKNSEEFLGVFDRKGNLKFRFLHYPKSLSELDGFLEPSTIYNSGFLEKQNRLIVSFPSEGEILIIDSLGGATDLEKIKYPKSRYFNFNLEFLGEEVSNDMGAMKKNPSTHYFGSIRIDKENLYMQSFMKDNKNLDRWLLTSHIMKYNFQTETWAESQNPENILNLGILVGVQKDTLIFVEASVMNRNEKYIKRAVLRPIKD
jgi:hypothetical protein